MRKFTCIIALISFINIIGGCKKYLDAKTDSKLVIISKLGDLQSLLDFYNQINYFDPGVTEASSDNYYLTDADWGSREQNERDMYIWEKGTYPSYGISGNDWSRVYNNVYKANVVLDNIQNIERTETNAQDWDNVKGQAVFLRARSFLNAAYIWALAYDANTANTDLGIPLRLNSDFNEISHRATVQQTYDQIIKDLKESVVLLPSSPIHVLRSSKAASFALLARTYLSMREYDSCLLYSDLCLQIKNTLMDYQSTPAFVNSSPSFMTTSSFTKEFNPEIIMENRMTGPSIIAQTRARIDSSLLISYDANDLRKVIFFKPNVTPTNTKDTFYTFRGSYAAAATWFDGIATDEVYLMRAECYARKGNVDLSMKDLNDLLRTRWKKSPSSPPYANHNAIDGLDALRKVLIERRKELVMRGLRWMDIKRLNKEGANIILKRILNGQTYTLQPHELRYALPIPEDIVSSSIPQNPR